MGAGPREARFRPGVVEGMRATAATSRIVWPELSIVTLDAQLFSGMRQSDWMCDSVIDRFGRTMDGIYSTRRHTACTT